MRGRVIDLVQGSDEWLAWRRGGVTATAAGEITGLYPRKWDRTAANLEAKLLDLASDWFNSEARERMDRGHTGEALLRAAFETKVGRLYSPACVEHFRLPQIRASLDGLNADSDSLAEFKWPTKPYLWQEVSGGQMPPYYYCQVQHQLLASGCSIAYFVVGRLPASGEVEYVSLEVRPNRDFIERMLKAELAFWARIEELRAGQVAA